ncbi:DUF1294 domain-containing protein [Lachnospiraceae bacterium OttesenSCG-928-D06]|nr:DUF1294 domain-containing protein [Lachnospiraceae bacterium OttesenSCG-928-D06]
MVLLQQLFILYLILINIIGFIAMGSDKKKARRGVYRTPEATLFLIAWIGGSLGSLAGMYTFRHKTKHRKFTLGIPFILFLHIAVLCFLFVKVVFPKLILLQ